MPEPALLPAEAHASSSNAPSVSSAPNEYPQPVIAAKPLRCPVLGLSGACPAALRCPQASTTGDAAAVSAAAAAAAAAAAPGVHQAWTLKRPQLQHDPKLTRRQLRLLNKAWTLEEVRRHRYCDDGWIAVDGKVYDITEHVVSHPGWETGCQVTTVLSILAHLGTDCTEEFREIHRPYPQAWRQLKPFYIGELVGQS